MGKIFETNSSFYVKQRTTGKVQFLFVRTFFLVLKKILFWEKDRALGYNSISFESFLIFPIFLRALLLSWQLGRLLVYTIFITNNHASFLFL